MSPDRAAMSGVVSSVSFLAGLGGGIAVSKVPFPRPGTDAADIRRYFGQRPSPLRVSGPGQLVSAAPAARPIPIAAATASEPDAIAPPAIAMRCSGPLPERRARPATDAVNRPSVTADTSWPGALTRSGLGRCPK